MQLPQIITLVFCVVVFGGAAIALSISRGSMTDEELWGAKKTIVVHTDSAPELVAKVVRWFFLEPRFAETVEKMAGREFHTRFRHDQRTLSVRLHVKVTPSPGGTALSVRCFPEWFANDKAIALYHVELRAFAASVCSTKIVNHS